jgi:ribosomal protein S18
MSVIMALLKKQIYNFKLRIGATQDTELSQKSQGGIGERLRRARAMRQLDSGS